MENSAINKINIFGIFFSSDNFPHKSPFKKHPYILVYSSRANNRRVHIFPKIDHFSPRFLEHCLQSLATLYSDDNFFYDGL